jgi:general secretion pathway protein C
MTAIILAKASASVFGYWLTKKVGDKVIVKPISRQIESKEEKIFAIANERNLFGAKREYVSLEDDMDEDDDPGRWQDAGPSSLPLKLVSTLVSSGPFSSRAVILNISNNKSSVYSINECDRYKKQNSLNIETVLPSNKWEPNRPCNNIDGMAIVRRIEEFKVYIFNTRDRRWEYLSLMGEDRRPKTPIIFGKEEDDDGIRKIGAYSYEIDQSALDKALGNVAKLMTEAKALPKVDAAGNISGFEMVYIKDKSLFEKIGIEKMDVLTRINGYDLSSLEKALELFSKLRYSDKFTIDMLRGGSPTTLDFRVNQNR